MEKSLKFGQKQQAELRRKKIANLFKLHFLAAKTSKNEKKTQKSSIKKKVSAWDGTGRRQDKEQKSYFVFADGQCRNQANHPILHKK